MVNNWNNNISGWWWFGTWMDYDCPFSIWYWEVRNPKWRVFHHFFRGIELNHQPVLLSQLSHYYPIIIPLLAHYYPIIIHIKPPYHQADQPFTNQFSLVKCSKRPETLQRKNDKAPTDIPREYPTDIPVKHQHFSWLNQHFSQGSRPWRMARWVWTSRQISTGPAGNLPWNFPWNGPAGSTAGSPAKYLNHPSG